MHDRGSYKKIRVHNLLDLGQLQKDEAFFFFFPLLLEIRSRDGGGDFGVQNCTPLGDNMVHIFSSLVFNVP